MGDMAYPEIQNRHVDNLAIKVFGHRIFESQTLYEYLIEFLLVFVSPKEWGPFDAQGGGSMAYEFPPPPRVGEPTDQLHYMPAARMGLKRFIFFERSKMENRYEVDKRAYRDLMKQLCARTEVGIERFCAEDIVAAVQYLFYGFDAVLRNRAWFAQCLLPLTPEVIFCEAIGNRQRRRGITQETFEEVDGAFEFMQHVFLARGGEVYFLHLVRGLLERPHLKVRLEEGLRRLVQESFPEISILAQWVDEAWLDYMDVSEAERIHIVKKCEWIPDGYARRAPFSVEELVNVLESEMPALDKMNLLAVGIAMHVLRMMHEQAVLVGRDEKDSPTWVMQVDQGPHKRVRQHAVGSYVICEEDFVNALGAQIAKGDDEVDKVGAIKDNVRNSSMLFRKLGKSIGLIVPPKGANARFTVNEKILSFLVLATVRPGQKVLLDDFLGKIFNRYGLVIGPEQSDRGQHGRRSDVFDANLAAFQKMLKQSGFLRDLSDATAIVENPFGGSIT